MSRYKIQIETGLIGIALCLAIFFWTKGIAVNPENIPNSFQQLPRASSPVEEVLKEMNFELTEARRLIITDPNHIVFITRDGMRRDYRFNHQSLWKNETPVIYGITSFHFEYRNKNGQLLTRANHYQKEIRRIHYLMNFSPHNKMDYANFRIKLKSTPQTDAVQVAMSHPQ
jgi:hypothetical protein